MRRGQYLCVCHGDAGYTARWFVLDLETFAVPATDDIERMPGGAEVIVYAGRPGYFVLLVEDRVELWDMRARQLVRPLKPRFRGSNFHVQDDSVYLIEPKTITVLEHCLRGLA
jgi:hypothetical protein